MLSRPAVPASLPGQPETESSVPAKVEGASGTSATLRLAAAWLALLATLGIVLLLLAAWLTSSWPGDEAYPLRMALGVGFFGACGLTAVVSWRAAAPSRPRAGIMAFAIGVLALIVILVPAVAVLLPPAGLYGLDVYAVGSAARLPWSVVIVVPAVLMVFGTVRRWCVVGDAAAIRRRKRIATAATLAILAPISALVAVDAAQPFCDPSRTCVAGVGISFVLPDYWSRAAPESNELFAATAADEWRRFVIEDGARVIRDAEAAVPTDLDGVAARVSSLLEGGGGLFGSNTGVSTQRVELPVGPAVRVAYTNATSFFLTYYQTTISYWFFIDERLVVLEYMRGYGESTPPRPSDTLELTELLDSLRTLR
jgi:hypothetical protein